MDKTSIGLITNQIREISLPMVGLLSREEGRLTSFQESDFYVMLIKNSCERRRQRSMAFSL